MIGDMAKRVITADAAKLAWSARPTISYSCSPITETTPMINNPDLSHADPYIYITYKKILYNNQYKKQRVPRFRLSSDFVPNGVKRFHNYQEFLDECKKDYRFKFIKDYFHITNKAFKRAHDNYGVMFMYALDWDKYEKELKKKEGYDEGFKYNPYSRGGIKDATD